jgi:hypothetical protein
MKNENRYLNPFTTDKFSLYNVLKNKGMLNHRMVNFDKMTKKNLHNVNSKLKVFNIVTRFFYRLIGFENYFLFIRLLRSFGRYESQIHILNKKYDTNNIKY